MPLNFDDCLAAMADLGLSPFEDSIGQYLAGPAHGNEERWDQALAALPAVVADGFACDHGKVSIGKPDDLPISQADFTARLKAFMPWRKGPWRLFGVDIDTEWRSDWKWQRLVPHISSLAGRSVLDVGCGNGYYLFRMLDAGARFALGIDPTLLFLYQFALARQFAGNPPAHILPLKSEQLPPFASFDTVFSLGVLYHRRAPVEHISELMRFLRPGGELVLESLVIPGEGEAELVPEVRYARMANVWSIPTVTRLEAWLMRAGFTDVRTVDVNQTSRTEQRRTAWMNFQSLADFLDPENSNLTVEGYPAPRRAVLVARRPG